MVLIPKKKGYFKGIKKSADDFQSLVQFSRHFWGRKAETNFRLFDYCEVVSIIKTKEECKNI